MVIVEVLVVREGFVLAVVMVMWVEVDILRCVSKRDCLNVCNVKLQGQPREEPIGTLAGGAT